MNKTKQKKKSVKNFGMIPYLFVLPGVLLFIMIAIVPMFETLFLSFTNWDGVNRISSVSFVGLRNYIKIFFSDELYISLKNNIIYAAVGITIPIILGLVQAAVIVNSRVRWKNGFQLLMFLPQILSSIIMSVMWLAIYDPATGLLNSFLAVIGRADLQRAWLGDKSTALICLLVMSVWGGYGFNTVLYCTAIRAVDNGMYEAARIDGANSRQMFWHITIPSIRNTTVTLVLLSLIGAFKVFDQVFQMTKGGPGYYTYVLSYYLYNTAFSQSKIGMGCAIAMVQTVLVLSVSKIFQTATNRGDE